MMNKYPRVRQPGHECVIDEEWDVLLVLDACRFDVFEKMNLFSGVLRKRVMNHGNTKTWLQEEIVCGDVSDVVYVSPIICLNTWFPSHGFHQVVPTWKLFWNYQYGTVLPEETTKAAVDAIQKFDEQRVLVHYLQPHIPFLTEPSSLVRSHSVDEVSGNNGSQRLKKTVAQWMNQSKMKYPSPPFWWVERVFGSGAGVGELFFSKGWQGILDAYELNLKRVLSSVVDVVELCQRSGKTVVITSDHGEFLGEMNMFGHGGRLHPVVNEVPWLEVNT